MQLLEILLILGLIVWQTIVFVRNRALIARVSAMYPPEDRLTIKTVAVASPRKDNRSDRELILAGAASFTLPDDPARTLALTGQETVADDGLKQWLTFQLEPRQNQWQPGPTISQDALEQLLTTGGVRIQTMIPGPDADTAELEIIVALEPSTEFVRIVEKTNKYLTNNFGAAADFLILKDISERDAEALDDEIQAQIATPLYLGLLGTFLGAMFGLGSLLLHTGTATPGGGGTSFLGDEQIISFLGGVGIAMVGSFVGLLLTLGGNQLLKTARARRDRLKNDYYTFLQKELLPKLNSDMQRGMGELRAVLNAFNQDFFAKIQNDFFAKLAQLLPLVGKMSENIVVQKDFLEKLQTIGYTELANATIRVFDRVDQSAASFEKFMGYQTALNHTVQMGIETTSTMAALLNRLNSLEQAAQQLPEFVSAHDKSLREMVAFFQEQKGTLANVRAGLEQRLDQSALSLQEIVDRRINEMEAERQQADDKLRQYFATLNDQNIYDKVVRYLQPFGDLPTEQRRLTAEQNAQNKRVADVMDKLEARLRADEQIQLALHAEVKRLARVQEELAQRGFLGRLFGGRPKAPNA
jgi:hypothetical protein